MKKIIILLAGVIGWALAADCPSATAQFPAVWKPLKAARIAVVSGGIVTVDSPGKMGGMSGTVQVSPRRRFHFRCEVRGNGTVQLGICGAFGWAYSPEISLGGDWQQLELAYADSAENLTLSLYSTLDRPSTFEVRNFSSTVDPVPELTDTAIAPTLFHAADYPGSNGKRRKVADAADGCAIWGKCWYRFVKLPVPTNSRKLYYYVHLRQNTAAPMELYLLNGAQKVNAAVKFGEKDTWRWLRLAPIEAAIALPEVSLSCSGDPATEILVDKIVVSTKDALNSELLDRVE